MPALDALPIGRIENQLRAVVQHCHGSGRAPADITIRHCHCSADFPADSWRVCLQTGTGTTYLDHLASATAAEQVAEVCRRVLTKLWRER